MWGIHELQKNSYDRWSKVFLYLLCKVTDIKILLCNIIQGVWEGRIGGGGGGERGRDCLIKEVKSYTHHKNEVIMDTSRKNCHQKHNDFYIWHEAMILTT